MNRKETLAEIIKAIVEGETEIFIPYTWTEEQLKDLARFLTKSRLVNKLTILGINKMKFYRKIVINNSNIISKDTPISRLIK